MLPIAVGSFVNARFTTFTFALLLLWIFVTRRDARLLLAYLIPMLIGFIPAFLLMRTNPAVVQNHVEHGNMAMWIAPFVVVAAPLLLLAARPIARSIRTADGPVRALLLAGVGYLTAYGILYLLRQSWYGAIFSARDGSVAAAISDPALLGILPALFLGSRATKNTTDDDTARNWIALWFLGFLAVSIAGFGQAWFLRFGPQRLEVCLWLPLAVLAWAGLALWRTVRDALCGSFWDWNL